MDNVINKAIELGKLIQQSDRFVAYRLAQQANDENKELQNKIDTFENKRTELTTEVQKPEKDAEKLKLLDAELKELYNEIMADESYIKLNEAQQDIQQLINAVSQIINGSAAGENPEEIDYNAACSPNGCSGCSGC